ncbi:UNVERIFIED_CONTAM: hypothetical protein HDU68_001721 [Siphonaria sp. JEL0065]|nr:hypothetical protein HDU68_001721 [Siphonaria sp. JEL0065]
MAMIDDDYEPTDMDIELLELRVLDLEQQLALVRSALAGNKYPSSNASTPTSSIMSIDDEAVEFQEEEHQNSTPTDDRVELRRMIALAEAENAALREICHHSNLPLPATFANASSDRCLCLLCTPAHTAEVIEKEIVEVILPPFNAEAIKRELASVPALSNSQDLIDEFCNLFITPENNFKTFFEDDARFKNALFAKCSTIAEKVEVLDALDRGRRENLEYVDRLCELLAYGSNSNCNATTTSRNAVNIFELLEIAPSLQCETGKQLVKALEHNYLGLQNTKSQACVLTLLQLKRKLGDFIQDTGERSAAFEFLMQLERTIITSFT